MPDGTYEVGDDSIGIPDTVFALGEAGRKLMEGVLTENWFLKEVMREDPPESRDKFDVYLVDSAIDETDEVGDLVEEFESVRDAEKPERTSGIVFPRVTPINVLRNNQYNSRQDLIAKETVGEIIRETGTEHWWLEDSEAFVPDDKHFSSGAVRRRALSKAYYYGTKASSSDLDNAINQVQSDVAIVLGLGGGTGSGLFIDLAREIDRAKSGVDVTLFAVLPHGGEAGERRANAMAALSELEFLALTDEETGANPFENIVLLPFEPVREGNKTNSKWATEFDNAFLSTLTSYYSADTDDRKNLLRKTPRYAPFTVAVPQVLRYNIDAINEIEADFEAFVDRKNEVIEFERDLYEGLVDDLLTELSEDVREAEREDGQIYIDGEQKNNDLVEPSERARLNERIENMRKLVNLEVFNQLEYQSVEIFQAVFNEADHDDARVMIDNLQRELENRQPTREMDDNLERTDINLGKTLENEIRALVRRKQLIQYNHLLDDDLVSGAVDVLIGNYGPKDRTVDLRQLQEQRETERGRRIQAEDELEDAREELESAEERIEDAVEEWQRAAGGDLETLVELESNREALLNEAARLDDELRQVATRVGDAATTSEVQPAEVDFDFAGVTDRLARFGVEELDFTQTHVEDAVGNLKRAKELRLEETGGGGFFGVVRRLIEGSDGDGRRDVYDRIVEDLRSDDPQVFSISDWSDDFMRVTVTLDPREAVRERLDARRDELIESILDALRSAAVSAGASAPDDLGDIERQLASERLAANADPGGDIETAIEERLEAELVGDLEARVEDLEARVEAARDAEERFEHVIDVFNAWQQQGDLPEQLEDVRDRTGELGEQDIDETDAEYRFIRRVQHDNIHQALNKSDIEESGVWTESGTERDKIERALKDFARDVVGKKQYLKVDELAIEARSADSGRGYDGHGISTVFMSRAFDDSFNDSEIRGILRDSIYVADTSNQYTNDVVGNGHPWEVGMTVFLSGVFLDNLENVTEQRTGYYSEYGDWERSNPESIATRHSYGLAGEDESRFSAGRDHGLRTVRGEMLNLNDSDAHDLFVNAEADTVVDELFERIDAEAYVADHPFNTAGDEADE